MSTAPTKPMTSEEFWALPDDDGVERWLVKGELRERYSDEDAPMSRRRPIHSRAVRAATVILDRWCQFCQPPKPVFLTSDVYFRLQSDPESNVGIDIAVISAEQDARLTTRTRYIDGTPLLAVEVLSGSDTAEGVYEKTQIYLEAKTPVVWVVDPFNRIVIVHRPNAAPVFFNESQELTSEPELPGFRCPVSELFRTG